VISEVQPGFIQVGYLAVHNNALGYLFSHRFTYPFSSKIDRVFEKSARSFCALTHP
jgi:hypothetical protein